MEQLTSDDPRWIGDKRYQVLARLGNGGMGRVYLGKSRLAERVAIKVILPQWLSDDTARRRFDAEVQNLQLAHGIRVAQYIDSDLSDEQPWVAVQYVAGRTLRQHVDDRGALSAPLVAAMGAMLAEGLATIHGAGLLHRDLKPANIMLGEHGPCIIDLGLAVLQERDSHLTQTGWAVGTAAYMPPEQAGGEQNLTPAADVYALGATLLYAATAHNPYPPSNALLLAKRITDPDDHPDLSGLPKQLHTIVGAMLAFDTQARPTVSEVLTDLAGIATSGGTDFEVVRRELTASTFVPPPAIPHPPKDLDDPVVDDDWSLGPTELISRPPLLPDSAHEESSIPDKALDKTPDKAPDATAEGTSAATPDTTPAGTPKADLTWLVAQLRRQYARRATL